MGLRQSKRSVDISGSPKKEAPAAVVEKTPQNNEADTVTIEKIDEEIKSPVNGETKTTEHEPVELVLIIDCNCYTCYTFYDVIFFTFRKRVHKRILKTRVLLKWPMTVKSLKSPPQRKRTRKRRR